jgi:hypothetical protein
MAKCSLVGCNNKPVGGVEEIVDAGSFDHPHATLPGLKTAWCIEHKEWLSPEAMMRRHRTLTKKELES